MTGLESKTDFQDRYIILYLYYYMILVYKLLVVVPYYMVLRHTVPETVKEFSLLILIFNSKSQKY